MPTLDHNVPVPPTPDPIVSTRGRHRAELFLAALLTGTTVKASALQAGISEKTAHRLLKEDAKFQAAFEEAKRNILEPSILKLKNAVSGCIDVLEEIVYDRSQPAASRVQACRTIIGYAIETGILSDIDAG